MIALLSICVGFVPVSAAYQREIPITVDNVEHLELQGEFPGRCDQFSPDGRFIATIFGRRTIYDIVSQQAVLTTSGLFGNFSPDGNLFYADHDGVYSLIAGAILFEVPGMMNEITVGNFSSDGKLIAVSGYGVYDLSGTNILKISSYGVFSVDGYYLAILGNVYETAHWQSVFTTTESGKPSFSPDGKWLAVSGDGVYSTSNWEKVFSFTVKASGMYCDTIFSTDSTLVAAPNDGVYDIAKGQRLIETPARDANFSPDNHYFASSEDGLYDIVTRKRRFITENSGSFNSNGTLYAVLQDGIYNVSNGEKLSNLSGFFSPESHFLAVTSDDLGLDEADKNCLVYAVKG